MSFDDSYLLYLWSSMLISWITLSNSKAYRKLTRAGRARETAFCCSLTAALAIPLLDFFTTLPQSIALFIGVAVGTIGHSGWKILFSKLLDVAVDVLNDKLRPNRNNRKKNNNQKTDNSNGNNNSNES